MKKLQFIGRLIGAVIILWFVWHHSHWSVAISITAIFIAFELLGLLLLKIINELKELWEWNRDVRS